MPSVDVRGTTIYHEEMGHPADPVVVLISGLGRRLTMWPTGLAHAIVVAGYRVIRFDNRDAGRSRHFTGKVNPGRIRRAVVECRRPETSYLTTDMAADTLGLLDALGVGRAHAVGVSMGGRIAQEMAIADPDRLASLTSVVSSPGGFDAGRPDAIGRRALFRAPPPDRDGAIAAGVGARRLIASPGHFDVVAETASVTEDLTICFDPEGPGRQLAALWALGDRSQQLAGVTVPTLVIHGTEDHVTDVSGGMATAAAIPKATLVVIDGMGHDLVPAFWPEILRPLVAHIRQSAISR